MSDTTLTIDISKRNTVKGYNSEQLFQNKAYNNTRKFLKDSVDWIKDINEDKLKKLSRCRVHNTILISGSRGSGKTVFLYNISEKNNDAIYKDNG